MTLCFTEFVGFFESDVDVWTFVSCFPYYCKGSLRDEELNLTNVLLPLIIFWENHLCFS